MPRHIIAIEVECDHPEFDGYEALEWVVSHLDIATDTDEMASIGYMDMGEYVPQEGEPVPVKWYA